MSRGSSFETVLQSLAAGEVKPVYAVVGEDSGLREELVGRIRETVLGSNPEGSCQVVFGPPDPAHSAGGPTLAQVMDELRTSSLFADRKLVLVRAAEALLSENADAAQAAFVEQLSHPVPGAVLVLELAKLDKRTSLAKALISAGALVECPRLYAARYGEQEVSMSSSLGSYLRSMASERGVKLSEEAGRRLLELSDGEISFLRAELDKLTDYLADSGRAATADDVEMLAAHGTSDAASLVRYALSGETARALRAAEDAFLRGLEQFGRVVWDESGIALALVNTLARQLRTVERTVLNGGRCPPARSGRPLPPQVAGPIENAARRLHGSRLERAYREVLRADLALKSSSGRSPRSVVEELLVSLGGESTRSLP